jgi:hypothetical protein
MGTSASATVSPAAAATGVVSSTLEPEARAAIDVVEVLDSPSVPDQDAGDGASASDIPSLLDQATMAEEPEEMPGSTEAEAQRARSPPEPVQPAAAQVEGNVGAPELADQAEEVPRQQDFIGESSSAPPGAWPLGRLLAGSSGTQAAPPTLHLET